MVTDGSDSIFRVTMTLTYAVKLEASDFIKDRHFVSSWGNISFTRNTIFLGFTYLLSELPIPVVVRSRAQFRLLAYWDYGFESHWGCEWLSLVSVVCCKVEVPASGWSFVQRIPTECGVSECDREASIMRRSWPTNGYCAVERSKARQLIKIKYFSCVKLLLLLLFYWRIATFCSCGAAAQHGPWPPHSWPF